MARTYSVRSDPKYAEVRTQIIFLGVKGYTLKEMQLDEDRKVRGLHWQISHRGFYTSLCREGLMTGPKTRAEVGVRYLKGNAIQEYMDSKGLIGKTMTEIRASNKVLADLLNLPKNKRIKSKLVGKPERIQHGRRPVNWCRHSTGTRLRPYVHNSFAESTDPLSTIAGNPDLTAILGYDPGHPSSYQ